jgi:hypothetical protein
MTSRGIKDQMADPDDDIEVRYTVKELLSSIKKDQTEGFTDVKAKLDTKADRVDLARINARLDEHGRDIGSLKQWRQTTQDSAAAHQRAAEKFWTWPKRIGAAAFSVAVVLSPIVAALIH